MDDRRRQRGLTGVPVGGSGPGWERPSPVRPFLIKRRRDRAAGVAEAEADVLRFIAVHLSVRDRDPLADAPHHGGVNVDREDVDQEIVYLQGMALAFPRHRRRRRADWLSERLASLSPRRRRGLRRAAAAALLVEAEYENAGDAQRAAAWRARARRAEHILDFAGRLVADLAVLDPLTYAAALADRRTEAGAA